jgi:hypothetical protein
MLSYYERLHGRNPFRYSEPVPTEELIDRDVEAAVLLERANEGNNSRVVAPRRFGKTSLLRRTLHDAGRQGWAAVYIDFFGVLTLDDIAERIERAYAEQLSGRLGSWFSGVRRMLRPTVRAGGGPIPGAVEVTVDAQAEPPLLERLALPRRLNERHGKRTLVVFDEFQDVLAAQDRADAIIRSEIQHHGDAASYIFSGSHLGMMRELFGDRRRAFYGQAGPIELSPLAADEVAEYIADRFERSGRSIGGALDPLLAAAEGHPQRTMLLAHAVWERTAAGESATEETWVAAEDAVAHDVRDELRAIWTSLRPSQRRVLAAIAENTQRLYASNRRHGGSRGGVIGSAAKALEDRGEIVRDEQTPTGFRVTDPLFARWVRAGRPEA